MTVANQEKEIGRRAQVLAKPVEAIDWPNVQADLDAQGWAVLPKLLYAKECDAITQLYDKNNIFRSKIIMARHGFGRGEYQYFAYPLPTAISTLRTALYSYLARVANRWHATPGNDVRFPKAHAAFIQRCHRAGQTRPTPLLLRYGKDDYNCLHHNAVEQDNASAGSSVTAGAI